MSERGGVQGMPYVLNPLYFEGCVTMVSPGHLDGLGMRRVNHDDLRT